MEKTIITGYGLILGDVRSGDELWKRMQLEKRIPLHVEADLDQMLKGKGLRLLDRNTKLSLVAIENAIEKGNISLANLDLEKCGIALGDSFGSIDSITGFDLVSLREGFAKLNPMNFINTVMNAPAGQLAIKCGIKGINVTLSTGATSSMDAILYSMDSMKNHEIEVMFVGGVEELSDIYTNFMKCNGYEYIDIGEGAAFLILENKNLHECTNFPMLLGYERRFSTISCKDICKSVMQKALESSNTDIEDVAVVISSINNNSGYAENEEQAIDELFKEKNVLVYSPKNILGERYSTSGILQVITALEIIKHRKLPNGEILRNGHVLVNLFPDQGNFISIVIGEDSY